MRPVELNFIRPRRSPWAGWALFGLGLLLSVELVYSHAQLRREIALQETQEAGGVTSARRATGMELRGDGGGALARPVREAVAVIDRLSLPWAALFNALERAAREQVALLAIQPDPERGTVLVSGEAKSYADVLAYLRGLESMLVFHNARLVSHETRQDDPQRPVLFTATVGWKARP